MQCKFERNTAELWRKSNERMEEGGTALEQRKKEGKRKGNGCVTAVCPPCPIHNSTRSSAISHDSSSLSNHWWSLCFSRAIPDFGTTECGAGVRQKEWEAEARSPQGAFHQGKLLWGKEMKREELAGRTNRGGSGDPHHPGMHCPLQAGEDHARHRGPRHCVWGHSRTVLRSHEIIRGKIHNYNKSWRFDVDF